MKKITPVIVALLLAIAAWNALDASDMQVNWNGEEVAGPLGALAGLLCAGGLLAGLLVLAVVAVLVAFLMAGVGFLLVGGLALLLALLLAPFLLPLLIPLALIAFIATRGRRRRA
ncbi:MAG TPA: hypothetical protein DCW29_12975 [Janthinobacterium sp.]|nr:hypothetical protein [Janthinobacterium sp.]